MCIFKYIPFLKVNQHAQHSNDSSRFLLIHHVNLQTYFVFESMAIQGSCSLTMYIFKPITFLKVNQHAQHSNDSPRFLLIHHVNLQTYFVFESKSTFTIFKWLFKVVLFFNLNLQTYFVFESKLPFTTFK